MKSTDLSRDGSNMAYAHDLVCHEYAERDVCFVSLGGLDKQYTDCLGQAAQQNSDPADCLLLEDENGVNSAGPHAWPSPAVGFGVVAIDVTDPANPTKLYHLPDYADMHFTHQADLTADGAWLVVTDELDEEDNRDGLFHASQIEQIRLFLYRVSPEGAELKQELRLGGRYMCAQAVEMSAAEAAEWLECDSDLATDLGACQNTTVYPLAHQQTQCTDNANARHADCMADAAHYNEEPYGCLAAEHQGYFKDDYYFLAAYSRGMIGLKLDRAAGELKYMGFFDTYPNSNTVDLTGAWSVYPFAYQVANGDTHYKVAVADRYGLWMLGPRWHTKGAGTPARIGDNLFSASAAASISIEL